MSRPRLDRGIDLRAAFGVGTLFVVLAWVFATADLGPAAGFGTDSVTDGVGFALLGLIDASPLVTEGFLLAFILLAVVLDAALGGAVHLARREGGEH
ncbi:hypothetical protein [Halococcoides cellulosivorans]|uniref:Proton-conducting membrane transporter n=1 Tax=Halococcoides cellulosivorans TaxID=1679096 RepID=A0A2R4WZZ5_9EURY|nr:hypothetical protein [Halococcoides cellulosivorans]AWB27085.1 hypothetical protein HARCEL1_04870 [Halococcoides cellulosivorans]